MTEPAEITAHGRSGGYDVTVKAFAAGGRWEVDTVIVRRSCRGKPVSPEGLRQVSVYDVLGPAITTRNRAERLAVEAIRPRAATLRAAGPSDETLQAVAAIYRAELGAVRAAPTAAVCEVLGIPRSTAGRWVTLARRRGHLGAARGVGKVGNA